MTMLPSGFSYIKGLCDGALILILIGLMWMFIVRSHRAILAGWFFALAVGFFVELDLGFAGPVALSTLGLHAASTGAAVDALDDVYAGRRSLTS